MATVVRVDTDEETYESWFEDWLRDGGAEYYKNDSRTDEGIKNVLKYKELEDEWEGIVSLQKRDKQIHRVMLLLADKKMRGDTYLGLIKMMHRLLAIARVITRSAINHFTARIQPGTLRMEHFI